jgi:hypothetical protein
MLLLRSRAAWSSGATTYDDWPASNVTATPVELGGPARSSVTAGLAAYGSSGPGPALSSESLGSAWLAGRRRRLDEWRSLAFPGATCVSGCQTRFWDSDAFLGARMPAGCTVCTENVKRHRETAPRTRKRPSHRPSHARTAKRPPRHHSFRHNRTFTSPKRPANVQLWRYSALIATSGPSSVRADVAFWRGGGTRRGLPMCRSGGTRRGLPMCRSGGARRGLPMYQIRPAGLSRRLGRTTPLAARSWRRI